MSVPFYKMNGLGNEFVVIDRRRSQVSITPEMARAVGDPNSGVGFDQLITIDPGEAPADVRMGIWNRDGGEVAACGNATRCVAQLLFDELGKEKVTIETNAGLLRCAPAGDGLVRVDMGKPLFDWQDIPLAERMDTHLIDIKLGPIDAPVLFGPGAVNVGNPHCIFFVEDVADHDLERFGPLVENHALFPERANVSIAQIQSPSSIRQRVWERGVGVTKACGTAACAVVPAGVRRRLCDRTADVTLDGGTLHIEWAEQNDRIYMTGPTSLDYESELDDRYFSDAAVK